MNRDKLISAGIDYDEGANRFGGANEAYEKYLKKFFSDNLMQELEHQLEQKNFPCAFEIAHNLKGMSGNLSINRFYSAICEISDLLKANNYDADYRELLSKAKLFYNEALLATEELDI